MKAVGVTQANSIMAIVKTTASGGEIPEKKNDTSKLVAAKSAPRAALARPTAKTGDPNTFVQDTIAEMKRVVWPSRETVRAGVVVTIGLLVFFSVYIFGLDQFFTVVFRAMGLDLTPQ